MKPISVLFLLLCVVFISLALSYAVYEKTDGELEGRLIATYTFGLVALAGMFTVFPGGTKIRDEWGERVRVGRVNNLSTAQVVILLSWFIGFGSVVVYFVEFRHGL